MAKSRLPVSLRGLWGTLIDRPERLRGIGPYGIDLHNACVHELAFELQRRILGEHDGALSAPYVAVPSHAVAPLYLLRIILAALEGACSWRDVSGVVLARIATSKERAGAIAFLGAVFRLHVAAREDMLLAEIQGHREPDDVESSGAVIAALEILVVREFRRKLAALEIDGIPTAPISEAQATAMLTKKLSRPAVYIATKITHGDVRRKGKREFGAYLNRYVLRDMAGLF